MIKSLSLQDFRNYSELKIDFSPGLNFLFGRNGQGKTSLIEALYFSTHLKSFRVSNLQTLCSRGCESCWITADISKRDVDHQLRTTIDKGRKRAILDDRVFSYTSEFVRNFFSLLFAPDQLVLFKEYPLVRRAYFDRLLFLIDRQYCLWIKEFNRVKKQKGILLKQQKRKGLDAWNRLLSEVISKITVARRTITDKINRVLSNTLYELTGRSDKLLLGYRENIGEKVEIAPFEIYKFLWEKKEKECEIGHLHYGPHRDDYWISMGGSRDRSMLSQGEYRISFLSLQLAVNQIIIDEMKFYPILLLDDILSELDEQISLKAIECIAGKKNQVFITSASISESIAGMGSAYHIESGKIFK